VPFSKQQQQQFSQQQDIDILSNKGSVDDDHSISEDSSKDIEQDADSFEHDPIQY